MQLSSSRLWSVEGVSKVWNNGFIPLTAVGMICPEGNIWITSEHRERWPGVMRSTGRNASVRGYFGYSHWLLCGLLQRRCGCFPQPLGQRSIGDPGLLRYCPAGQALSLFHTFDPPSYWGQLLDSYLCFLSEKLLIQK